MSVAEIGRRDGAVAPDDVGRSCGDLLAEVQHADLVTEAQDEVHVMVHEQDRHACVGDGAQLLAEPQAFAGVQTAGRLIEADTTAAEGLELFPQLTDLVLAQGRIAQMQSDADKAKTLFRRAIEMGDAPSRY